MKGDFMVGLFRKIFGWIIPKTIKIKVWGLWKKYRFLRRIADNYIYDFRSFVNGSAVDQKFNSQIKLRTKLTLDYHKIEKGLSLKNPRVGFGKPVVKRLLNNLHLYRKNYDFDQTAQVVLNVLFAYYEFNLAHDYKDDRLQQKLAALREELLAEEYVTHEGGIKKVTKQQIQDAAVGDMASFFESRYSIRQFTSERVDSALIENAIKMAQKTPSVCNRQPWKVYVLSNEEDKHKALELQHGNRGFGDQADKILIVTTERGNYTGVGERNQGWVDGGMFAMSFVYALHSLGLGTCCLNWCVPHSVDKKLKQVMNISVSEIVIVMIAVGHLPDELHVAQSPRRDIRGMLPIDWHEEDAL